MFHKVFIDGKKLHRLNLLFVILVVAVVGTYLLISSHAASPYVAVNASSGILQGGAQTVQNCSGSSASNCVAFGPLVPMDGSVILALSQSGTPFAASSFWNIPLPANTPANPNDTAYSNDIMATYCGNPPNGLAYSACPSPGKVALSITQYSAPLYVVSAKQPLINIKSYCSSGTIQNQNFVNTVLTNVPVPADAHGAAGTDENIQIYQPSTDKYWDFWQFQKDSSGSFEACYGGFMTGVSSSSGIFTAFGASGTGLPFIGGVARIEELQAGQINHVLGIELPANLFQYVLPANTPGATKGISWPAPRSDGTNTNNLAVPEGLRFRLPASLDLNQYNLCPLARVIAVTAQKYGFVLQDTAPNIGIRLGDPTTYTAIGLPNPYTSGTGVGGVNNGNLGLEGGCSKNNLMQNFPWSQLQALPFNYGNPGS